MSECCPWTGLTLHRPSVSLAMEGISGPRLSYSDQVSDCFLAWGLGTVRV